MHAAHAFATVPSLESWHWKVEPCSLEENPNVALLEPSSALVMDVSGGVVVLLFVVVVLFSSNDQPPANAPWAKRVSSMT